MPDFGLSEICKNRVFFLQKFSSKNAKFGAENPRMLGKFRDKIESLSRVYAGKLQLPAPPTSLTLDPPWRRSTCR